MNDANTQCFYGDKEYEIIPEDIHYEFKVIMPEKSQDTLRLLKVFEVSNVRFERSGQ